MYCDLMFVVCLQRASNMAEFERMRNDPKNKKMRGPPLKKMPSDLMLFMRSYMLLRGLGSGMNVTVRVNACPCTGASTINHTC